MKKSKKARKPAKKASKAAHRPAAAKKSALGTPYGDRILVRPEALQQTSAFGIIIPDTSKEKPETGVVVAVGPGKRADDGTRVPVGVQVGDTIMFSKYGYDEVKIAGQDYYLIREDSVTYVF